MITTHMVEACIPVYDWSDCLTHWKSFMPQEVEYQYQSKSISFTTKWIRFSIAYVCCCTQTYAIIQWTDHNALSTPEQIKYSSITVNTGG